jgi:hypothetical protein
MAEDIEKTIREAREYIIALKVALPKRMGSLQLALLESSIQDDLTRVRSDPSYLKFVAELERELADAKEDGDLIRILYREGLERASIPME